MDFSHLHIVGNVLDILEGRVEADLLQSTSSMNFRFALGGATFTDRFAIGETLILDGIPFISWVEHGKVHTAGKKEAMSPFLIGIQQGKGIPIQCSSPTSLESFYGELSEKYPMGVAVEGALKMSLFKGVYLQKAPIYEENINTHSDLYWSSIHEIPDAIIRLFGVIIPQKGMESILASELARAFYQNPNDKGIAPFKSHTHAALLTSQGTISMVYHMLTPSLIEKGTFNLFPLKYHE